jgi:uncharacterized protein with ParB-like and HNH nuclease domain
MKASETKLEHIIEGTKQFVVPLFQRPYSWGKNEWGKLWEDLVELCEEENPRTHFIGSIVTMPTQSVPEGVGKFLLIDGQQRITTIFILLAALRDKTRTLPGTLADEIHGLYLTNQYKEGGEALKLLPTQVDRTSFQCIIQSHPNNSDDQINKAYRFFEKRLNSSKAPDVATLKKILVTKLSLVSITLDRDDNPHLIFESLNATGRPLTQADLIRNYFFMRIHVHQQEKIYQEYWRPIQDSLAANTPEFIRHFLMRDGGLIKQDEVYFALKDRANEHQTQTDIIAYLEKIAKFAGFYAKLINPDEEPKAKLRSRLKRLNRIEVTVAYPFLLNAYHDYSNNDISEEIFAECLDILENFMIRRFVCGVPTYGLNKIFPSLYAQAMQFDSLLPGLKEALKSKKYPRDTEFKERLITTPLYGGGNRTDKTKLILERLEESFEHKEPVAFEKTTIEHVMPQTPSSWWKSHLGESWEEQHEIYLHTIGNLTLTGYNSELSNDSFPNKLATLQESHLELNKYFQDVEGWTEKSIRQRAEALSNIALEVWKSFAPSSPSTVENNNSVTGKTPVSVTIVGEKVSVASWREVEQKTMEAIAELDDERFEDILGQYPKFIGREKEKFRSSRQLKNGVFIETNLSAERIREFCIQATTFAGLDKDDWHVEYVG